MKKILLVAVVILLHSCSIYKPKEKTYSNDGNLSETEKTIVNDFLDIELASEKYKNNINSEIIVIENAGNGIENLLTYEYSYIDFHSEGNEATAVDNERLGWILDTIQIKELKNKYSDKKDYYWTSSDVKNFKVSIMRNDTLRKYLKKDKFLKLSDKLILFIKKPIIIDIKNAFISIYSRRGFVGHDFSNYTALMKKTNGKWKIAASYWDGSIE